MYRTTAYVRSPLHTWLGHLQGHKVNLQGAGAIVAASRKTCFFGLIFSSNFIVWQKLSFFVTFWC